MIKYGIVTHSKYFNFANYGSMLQCYALQQTLDKLGIDNTVIDYRNDALLTTDINNPLKKMRDRRILSRMGCFFSYLEIWKANRKFIEFWSNYYRKTAKIYTSSNFNELEFDGYICGSDTIWDIDESEGFDRGFFADFDCMRGKHNISYSASVGDRPFTESDREILTAMLKNFKCISMREINGSGIIASCTDKEIVKTLDPTLLLDCGEYQKVLKEPGKMSPYLLLYSRQYNPEMVKFADRLAQRYGLKVVDISLQIFNFIRHKMAYNTGIDEFLGLMKNASYVVTNSYHGVIFAMQFRREFCAFTRDCCNNKITELLEMAGLGSRMAISADSMEQRPIDYSRVWEIIHARREESLKYLKEALDIDG